MNLEQLQHLARLLSAAFRGSEVDEKCVAVVRQLCSSVNFVSVSVLASNNMLVTAGNMASPGQCSVTLSPLEKAAATLGLLENRCLQLDLKQIKRPSPFFDCEEATAVYGCTAFAFAPIPAVANSIPISLGTKIIKGMGVLALGVRSSYPIQLSVLCNMLTLGHFLTNFLAKDKEYVLRCVYEHLQRRQSLDSCGAFEHLEICNTDVEEMQDESRPED